MKKILLLIVFLIPAGRLVAQDNDSTLLVLKVSELLSLQKQSSGFSYNVTTASQKVEAAEDVPATILVISKEQIIERGYEDISDLIKDLPSVDVIENAGRFGEYYTIRGVNGNDRFLIMVNGRKLNAPAGTFLSVGNSISIRMAERVEIVYGSSSVVYGSDAFSCVINIITEPVEGRTDVQAHLSYGSFNTREAFFSADATLQKDFSIKMFGRFYQSDGFTPKEEGDFAKIKDYGQPLNNRHEQPLDDRTIYVEAFWKKWKVGMFRQQFAEGNFRGLSPTVYVANKENMWKTEQQLYWLNRSFKIGSGTLDADITYTAFTQDPESRFMKFSVAGNLQSAAFNQYMTGRDRSLRSLFTYRAKIGDKFDFIAGTQAEIMQSIPAYAADHVLGVPLKFVGSVAETVERELTVSENKLGLFGQFAYNPSRKLGFTAAARYDFSKIFDNTFNTRLALIWRPNEKTFAKLIYGTAFQAPSMFYRYEQFGVPTVVMVSNADQDFTLKNQEIQSLELNIRQNFSQKFALEWTLYANAPENLIERRLYTNNVYNKFFNTYTNGLRNENIGSQRTLGTSLSLEAKAGKDMDIFASYSYTRAERKIGEGDFELLPRVAPHKINAGITLRNLFNKITFSSVLRYVNEVQTPMASKIYPGSQTAPGYVMLNLNLSVKNFPVNKMRFFTKAEIMLADKYENVGLYEGGIYTDLIPQAPFFMRAGLEFKL